MMLQRSFISHALGAIYKQIHLRTFCAISTAPKIDEVPEAKVKRKRRSPKPTNDLNISQDMHDYFNASGNLSEIEAFPVKFLRKKHKSPSIFYVAGTASANIIADKVTHDWKDDSKQLPIIEVNPGPGLLTKALLENSKIKDLKLIEHIDTFIPTLEKIQSNNPTIKSVQNGDFIGLWKLAFQDKMDQGNRVESVLTEFPRGSYNGDITARLVASVGDINFIKQMINSVVFRNNVFASGRCEMFLVMPPPLLIHLTCTNEAGYLLYRANTMLFQILFEYEFICKLPRKDFVPWQFETEIQSTSRLAKVNSIDPDCLYLLRIVPRRNLDEICSQEHLQALWFFIKQSCVSRKNRVIPYLEKWIPGCGIRLIVNAAVVIPPKNLFPNEDTSRLPEHSKPCMTISNRDYIPNINIFTQFGDLTPSQMVTLFDQFRHWPEYPHCPFLPSMETSLIKLETTGEENVDELEVHEEDQLQNDDDDKSHH